MPFQNPLPHVSDGTRGSTVNGGTTQCPLGDISFLTPTPFIHTQKGESGHIPGKAVLLLSSFASLFLAHAIGLGRPQYKMFPPREKEGGRQKGQNPREDAWLQSPAWDVTLDTLLLVSSLCSFNAPTMVVPEGCAEHAPTPMADVLAASLTLLCHLASWSKALWQAKWLLMLWLAKIQDINLVVCCGYSALFQDVILYLYSANQMLYGYCPS